MTSKSLTGVLTIIVVIILNSFLVVLLIICFLATIFSAAPPDGRKCRHNSIACGMKETRKHKEVGKTGKLPSSSCPSTLLPFSSDLPVRDIRQPPLTRTTPKMLIADNLWLNIQRSISREMTVVRSLYDDDDDDVEKTTKKHKHASLSCSWQAPW